jgi:L-alanine-DL-glutamate epimerase-like enolase superfamily enzyme
MPHRGASADGYLAPPPDKPGRGIELNEAVLRRYAVG